MDNRVNSEYQRRNTVKVSYIEPDAVAELAEYNRQVASVINPAREKILDNYPRSIPLRSNIYLIEGREYRMWQLFFYQGRLSVFFVDNGRIAYSKLVIVEKEIVDGNGKKDTIKVKEKQFFFLNLAVVQNSFAEIIPTNEVGKKLVDEAFLKETAKKLAEYFCSFELKRQFNIEPDKKWVPYIETRPSVLDARKVYKKENRSEVQKVVKKTAGQTAKTAAVLTAIFLLILLAFYVNYN